MYITFLITGLLSFYNALALTHPSCIEKQEKPTDVVVNKEVKNDLPKPFIDFSNKHTLKIQTKEHQTTVYNKLIEEGIPKRIAKYTFKLNFLERPTVDYKNQPEFKIMLNNYAKKFIERTPRAYKLLEHNIDVFLQAEKQYGVDKEAIAALILLESNIGENKGNLNILDALFTMSHPYNSTRTQFFTNELIAAFKLLSSSKHFFRNNTMGSWAGAMGYTQFIPSSVLAYAVDGNKDGIIDIINNKVDAIHSAANYLSKARWQKGQNIMIELSEDEIKGIDICKDLDKPYKDGTLVLQELNPDRYFITYGNYQTILRWNRSFAFAYGVQSIMNELKRMQEKGGV